MIGGQTDVRHVLLVETRTEGHHLTWLRYIAEDLLSAGFKVSAATSPDPPSRRAIEEELADLHPKLNQYPLSTTNLRSSSGPRTVVEIAAQARAGQVFFNSFDEIGSRSLRKAAFGLFPPNAVKGKLGGIYFRPRFLQHSGFSIQNWLKRVGFARLIKRNFFNRILLLDEDLSLTGQGVCPAAPLTFLPDPYPANFRVDSASSRSALGLESSRAVFLFYGGPYRRKGMHLTAEAFQQLDPARPLLLYGGQPPEDENLLSRLRELERRGMARLFLNRVSDQEEKLLFASADFVLLPYIGHFGSSGVLSRAVGAHKPVIASDEGLVGKRVRQHDLGLLFPTGDLEGLKRAIAQGAAMNEKALDPWRSNAARYSATCSREAFRAALLESFKA